MNKVITILPHHDNTSRASSTLEQFRQKPSFGDLIESFIHNGFAPSAAPIGGATVDDASAEVEALAQEYSAIEKLYTFRDEENKIAVTGEQVAQWVRENYKGKGAVVAVSGTRRAYALPVAQVVLAELESSPIMPRVVELEDTAFNSLHANLVMQAGQETVKPSDSASWLIKYAKENPNFSEADLVKVGIKRGRAQQLARAYKLHKKFPKLELLQNVAAGISPLPHKETLKEMLDTKIPKGAKDKVTDKLAKRIKSGDAQKSNRADKRALENALENASSDIVKFTIDCIIRNELDELVKTTDEFATDLNNVFEWSDETDETEVES